MDNLVDDNAQVLDEERRPLVYPAMSCDEGWITQASGSTADAISALEYAIDKGIRVSNNSWGGGTYSQALYDVIEASQAIGHIFIASAGNTSQNIDIYPHYPASYNLPNILVVAATDNDDNLGIFPSGNTSNYGSVSVDLGAPGVNIYSTVSSSQYGYQNGTSMAAPHVTGVVAQLMSRYPGASWQQVKYAVLSTVRPVDSLYGITVTGGVVDLWDALRDCNANGVLDGQDIAQGTSEDCSGNGIADECEGDCNDNGMADSCDIFAGSSEDCNGNGIPDECLEIEADCNGNLVPDACDIAEGVSEDCTLDGVPDECQLGPDCNSTGTADFNDICNAISSDCNGNEVPDECDLAEGTSADCNVNDIPDECDIAGGTSEDCTGDGIPDECDPDCNENGIPDSCDIGAGTSADCNSNGTPDECDAGSTVWPDIDENGVLDACEVPILYVHADAGGRGDGMSWANAFTDLQAALGIAASPPQVLSEIWVAAGTYTPTGANGKREAAFHLVTGVGVYGGFAGGETEPGQRDPRANLTVLSGDLNGDDAPGPANNEENSYHVVTTGSVNETAVLDGFTITGGHADGPAEFGHHRGAGMHSSGSPTVTGCVFTNNQASYDGGGMFSIYGASRPAVDNCAFIDNSAYFGGGMSIGASGPIITGGTFSGNSASVGAGLYVAPASTPTLINCTVSDNNGPYGPGMRINSLGEIHTTVINCIFWGNNGSRASLESRQIDVNGEGMPTVAYSCIQGLDLFAGNGNIGDDPQFSDTDFHLAVDSPCVDAGDPTFIPEPAAIDLDGEPRMMGGRVDMGVDEVAADCNANGVLDNLDIAEGTSTDCNNNYVPDECDVAEGTSADCQADDIPDECDVDPADPDGNGLVSADCQPNGIPDECDVGDGGSEDCNDNFIPDECDVADCGGEPACRDCNVNGVPDGCDLAAGTSEDDNMNAIPDECDAHPPQEASFPHSLRKNRYISFSPNPGTVVPVAFRVELTASEYYPDFTGVVGWAGQTDENGIVRVVDEPFFDEDWPVVVHLGGCAIVPAATYAVRATVDDTAFSDPLELSTVAQPAPKYWGDVVGELRESAWTEPNGVVNMDDVMAGIQKFQQLENGPHLTWVDVDPEVPNAVLNFTDIMRIVQGFKGEPYPFGAPVSCEP